MTDWLRGDWVVVCWGVFSLALLVGCTGTAQDPPDAAQDPPDAAPATPVPDDFAMTFGRGGGFTGRWQGYTVAPAGSVMVWNGYVAGENAEPAGTLTPEQRRALWQRVEAVGFFDRKRGETGNMTAFLEVTADGRTHRATWIPSVEGVEEITDPVEQLYVYCREVVQQATSEE